MGTNQSDQGWGQRTLSQGGKLSGEFVLRKQQRSGAEGKEKGVQGPSSRITRALFPAQAQHPVKNEQTDTQTKSELGTNTLPG